MANSLHGSPPFRIDLSRRASASHLTQIQPCVLSEPAYATDPTEGNCYDVLWQLVLFRVSSEYAWRAEAVQQMHMGFGGSADSPCASAFYPGSNPTSWSPAAFVAPTIEPVAPLVVAAREMSTAEGQGGRQGAFALGLLAGVVATAALAALVARHHSRVESESEDVAAYSYQAANAT